MQAYCNKRLIGGMYAESDLAAERRRADITLDGIEYRREEKVGCSWERIRVYSDAGEKSIGRPRGYYSTLNLSRMDTLDPEGVEDAASEVAGELCRLIDNAGILPGRVLVVGLGNAKMTVDSVGAKAAERVHATLHLRQADPAAFAAYDCSEIAVCIPGVTARTGAEPMEIVRGVCERLRPDAVLAIDALAARSGERVGTTIQLSDTGIFPGSGIGECRRGLNRTTVGAPVIAIGIPTVIDSRVYVLEKVREFFPEKEAELAERWDGEEPMFVSPRDMDGMTDAAADIVAGGINQAFGVGY